MMDVRSELRGRQHPSTVEQAVGHGRSEDSARRRRGRSARFVRHRSSQRARCVAFVQYAGRASGYASSPMKAIQVSVGVFVRGLTGLKTILAKGEAHASSRGIDPAALLSARLADDMNDLTVQVHWASEGAKLAVQRILGIASTPPAPNAKTFAELHERIDGAIAYLGAVDPEALEAGLERTIELPYRSGPKAFRGDGFLTEFGIPSFFFHLTTAYCILRREGVPLEKGDFMGS